MMDVPFCFCDDVRHTLVTGRPSDAAVMTARLRVMTLKLNTTEKACFMKQTFSVPTSCTREDLLKA